MDNDPPEDYHTLCQWFPIIRHARSVAKSNGMSVITIRVIVDDLGNPLAPWPVPEAVRLLPRMSSQETISDLLQKLMNGA